MSAADKALELAAEQQKLRAALASVTRDYGQQLVVLQQIIASPVFSSFTIDDQYETLSRAARVSELGHWPILASDYIARVVALPRLTYEDEVAALGSAHEIGNRAAAVHCLTNIARQWPERVSEISSRTLSQVVYGANSLASEDKFAMLEALYAAHWTLEWGIEPSSSWRDLTLLLLERHSLQRALDVSAHVSNVYVLIAMRSDRRFDAVIVAHPAQFDIDAAAAREAKSLQSLSEEHPKSLALKSFVLRALLHEQHYAAMLADSDSAMQYIRSTNFPDRLYDDYVEQHAAYFYLRSLALQREKRLDEAVIQLAEASHDGDITQLINLALLYCALDRPRDALGIVSTIGPARTSAFGAMQVEVVKLQAAVQLKDRVETTRSLQYLKTHHTDAPRAYLFALLVANDLDQAARFLVTELQDKQLREQVLTDVQDYPPTPETDVEAEIDSRWHSIVARKEVQTAIRKVGRVESYRVEAP